MIGPEFFSCRQSFEFWWFQILISIQIQPSGWPKRWRGSSCSIYPGRWRRRTDHRIHRFRLNGIDDNVFLFFSFGFFFIIWTDNKDTQESVFVLLVGSYLIYDFLIIWLRLGLNDFASSETLSYPHDWLAGVDWRRGERQSLVVAEMSQSNVNNSPVWPSTLTAQGRGDGWWFQTDDDVTCAT